MTRIPSRLIVIIAAVLALLAGAGYFRAGQVHLKVRMGSHSLSSRGYEGWQ